MPWAVVAGLGLCSAYFVYRNYVLQTLYPNLEDHTPGRDWYWPHVAHLINEVIAFALAAMAIIVAVITLLLRMIGASRATVLTADSQHEYVGSTELPRGEPVSEHGRAVPENLAP